jgi:hypothetical protein
VGGVERKAKAAECAAYPRFRLRSPTRKRTEVHSADTAIHQDDLKPAFR